MYMPIYSGEEFIKLHNIFQSDSDLCDEFKIQVEGRRDGLLELIAETDDELLEKYFSGEDLTEEDIKRGTTIGIQNGDIIPVICGSTI
ncbi:elongation factor G, partial [bacterium 210820-DFI.6.52]|nr:elongation factor G [bacterium 210820-DFI.6.52]